MNAEEGLERAFDELLARLEREVPPERARALKRRWRERLDGAPAGPQAGPAARRGAGAGDFPGRYGIVGASEAMQRVFELLEKMIPSDYPVLITGESGTGKELVARALHEHGPRRGRPFLSENCAAIPETLLESILFGHVKGAFTGAHRDNPGHFVSADKGTLFLDEIGDMPLPMQSKLLRVLQDGEVRPVGGEKVRKVDVRLVAATNKDIRRCVREKTFREDLYYRLNVLELRLPPLRERGDDVLLLAEYFLARAREETGRALELSDEAKALLKACPWPGNVRQLENEVRRAAALARTPVLGPADFTPGLAG